MTLERKHFVWAAVTALLAWTVWADRWSDGAKDCFAMGGTQFSSWGWSCHFHAVLKRGDH